MPERSAVLGSQAAGPFSKLIQVDEPVRTVAFSPSAENGREVNFQTVGEETKSSFDIVQQDVAGRDHVCRQLKANSCAARRVACSKQVSIS